MGNPFEISEILFKMVDNSSSTKGAPIPKILQLRNDRTTIMMKAFNTTPIGDIFNRIATISGKSAEMISLKSKEKMLITVNDSETTMDSIFSDWKDDGFHNNNAITMDFSFFDEKGTVKVVPYQRKP